jgi:catechol-2,3-dioxygenase
VLKEKHLANNYIQKLLGVRGLELTYVKFCIPPDDTPAFELHHWTDTDVVYGLKNPYTAHMALTMENLKAFHLKHASFVKFISSPLRAPDSKNQLVCFIADPDGNLIELVEELKDKEKKNEKV